MLKAFWTSLFSALIVAPLMMLAPLASAQGESVGSESSSICSYNVPSEVAYAASIVQIKQDRFVNTGSNAEVLVMMKNESNVPWFSHKANCGEDVKTTWLGTSRHKDRVSQFYNPSVDSGWYSDNRIEMLEERVDPGKLATFKFKMNANVPADYYREHFSPLIDGVTWLEDVIVPIDLQVGAVTDDVETVREKREFLYYSNSTGKFNLDGNRYVMIDLSKQRMYAKIDNVIVNEIRTSSGAYETPTPKGNLKIAFKNRVRIGGASPHYIMPYFMGLEWDDHKFNGYGFHDFPAYGNAAMRAEIRKRLANGEDYFEDIWADDWMWKNAQYDIGKAVSHGCVRNDKAWFVYDFLDVGDRVFIYNSIPNLAVNPMVENGYA